MKRGEVNRKDTGIVSDNTAGVNMASDRVLDDPQYAKAELQMISASLEASDCLYLPQGWHHHVFSQPDAEAGYNLALNVWVYREGEEPGAGWSLDEVQRGVSRAYRMHGGTEAAGTSEPAAAQAQGSKFHDEL